MQERRIASVDEMFDLLASMADGKFATMCYVNAVPVYKTKAKVDLDKFGQDLDQNAPQDGTQDPVYDRLRQYHDDDKMKKLNLGGVVSVTRYNLNWSSEEAHNKNLARYMSKKDEIDKKWGIYKDPEDRRAGGFDAVNTFGTSLGTTDNTRNRAYIHQNTAKARIKSDIYAVDEQGNIIGIVNPQMIAAIKSPKSPDAAVKALQALQKTDDEIKQYQKEIADLNFRHQKFLVDKILYIVATIGEDKFVYINDYLAKNIDTKSKMEINTQQFIDLANKMFREDETMTESQCQRFNIIKEDLMKHIKQSVDTTQLDENYCRRIVEDAAARIVCEYDDYGYDDLDDDDDEQEISGFEQYEQDYPNGDFTPTEIDKDDLAHWCNTHVFGYVIPNIFTGQLQLRWADEKRLNCEMAYRIYNSDGIEHTHKADYYIERPYAGDFDNNYIAVFSIKNFIGDENKPVPCYIVYQKPKDE